MKEKQPNRYQALVADVFFHSYKTGATVVAFTREELIATAAKLGIAVPKNAGDHDQDPRRHP